MIRILIACATVCAAITILLPGCDEESSKIIIFPNSGGTTTATNLVLFGSPIAINGSLGGRNGADIACIGWAPAGVTNIHAFVSIDGIQIADFPEKYGYPRDLPIYGPVAVSTARIADDWEDLMDGSIDVYLDDAGVMPDDEHWFSNSFEDGTIDTMYTGCSSYTIGDATQRTRVGQSVFIDAQWIDYTDVACNDLSYLLCIGIK